MADQMRGDHAGFAGHSYVQTPHLDRLASRGAVFEQVFAQAPICGPSRACIFSGRYVHEHGVWWNGVPIRKDEPLLPEIFRDAGYRTTMAGKLHLAPAQRSFGFEHRELHEELLLDELDLDAYENFLAGRAGPEESTEWFSTTSGVGVCGMDAGLEETFWVADNTCALLEEAGDDPFFHYASFVRPHSPYNPLPEFLDLYRGAAVDAPPFSTGEWEQVPPRVRATAESWGWDELKPKDFQEVRRHYAALCSQVDAGVGKILQTLEATGLADSTLVVFMSDHGDFIGEHGLLYKEHLYDGALHVPLVIAEPGRRRPMRYAGLVETIDVMPTVLELAGVPDPSPGSGRSLVPVLENPARVHREHVLSEWVTHCVNENGKQVREACVDPCVTSVRTDQWKYMHYHGEPGELYDLAADPLERMNRFGEEKTQSVVRDLRNRMPRHLLEASALPDRGKGNPYFQRRLNTTD